MSWSYPDGNENGAMTSAMSMTDEHHHCHDADSATPSACEEMGCVFCGFTVQSVTPRITAYVAHILLVPATSNSAPPRPEQPVELRPPIHLITV